LGRRQWALLIPGLFFAVGLSRLSLGDIEVIFAIHSLLMGYLFLAAYREMPSIPGGRDTSPGIRVIRLALLLLAVNFLTYVPIYATALLWRIAFPIRYLRYSALYDLSLQVMLGFGMVLYVMEKVREELERSNLELANARDRLEGLASMDPLTEVLNRRGFYSFMSQRSGVASSGSIGSVATIDMDGLKEINDSLGHGAGDAAIRATTKALRNVVRADDLIIRWGGDEFLVVLFGVSPDDAVSRLDRVSALIEAVSLPGSPEAQRLSISWGVSAFDIDTPLDRAIEIADSAMYRQKQLHRAAASGAVS
jgi:diguanylate cyclase (GGDEF)-like protein